MTLNTEQGGKFSANEVVPSPRISTATIGRFDAFRGAAANYLRRLVTWNAEAENAPMQSESPSDASEKIIPSSAIKDGAELRSDEGDPKKNARLEEMPTNEPAQSTSFAESTIDATCVFAEFAETMISDRRSDDLETRNPNSISAAFAAERANLAVAPGAPMTSSKSVTARIGRMLAVFAATLGFIVRTKRTSNRSRLPAAADDGHRN